MLGYDPESERHQHTSAVHYRLYLGRDGRPCVICAPDFDYPDYDQHRLLNNKAFSSEHEADDALRVLLADAATVLGIFPTR
jgi:hypothetical protein